MPLTPWLPWSLLDIDNIHCTVYLTHLLGPTVTAASGHPIPPLLCQHNTFLLVGVPVALFDLEYEGSRVLQYLRTYSPNDIMSRYRRLEFFK
jgi:hypothetical protein